MSDDVFTLVSRRQAPQIYILAESGAVSFSPPHGPPLDRAILDTAAGLIRNGHARRGTAGIARDGRILRVIALSGATEPHYAIFVENDRVTRSPVEDAARRYSLSARECDVLHELMRGASTAEIAQRLIIGEATVTTHIRNIGVKMSASKRKEIVAAILGGR